MAYSLGGTVAAATEATAREYGKTLTEFDTESAIFHGLPASSVTWMSHGDYISQVPDGFTVTVRNIKVSAGAGFLVALTGDIMTMPGLPKVPAAEKVDVDENGKISGLF